MHKPFPLHLAILAGSSLLLSQSAFAQEGGSQEIQVIAPRVGVTQDERASAGGIGKIMVYSVQKPVSFADLDLTSVKGVDELKQRIHDAAKSGCDQISKEYPLVKDDSCMKTAVDNAMVQANQVIDAANKS
jgi:UrcA family protein